jgi:hypothetical protein
VCINILYIRGLLHASTIPEEVEKKEQKRKK